MRDDSDQIVKWVGSNTDVHEIKLAEQELLVSEIRYRRLFEMAKDGILILDVVTGKAVYGQDAEEVASARIAESLQHQPFL